MFKEKPKNYVEGIRYEKGEMRPCDKCGKETNYYQHDFCFDSISGDKLYISVTKCESCSEKEERLEEWQNKQEMTDRTICPWCGYEFEGYEDGYEEEEEEECDCPSCGKRFIRNVEVTYSYTSWKPEELYEEEAEE